MKVLYYDCFAGISGDMNLGALIDLGVDPGYLEKELLKLPVQGYELVVKRDMRKGISGTRVEVVLHDDHEHTAHHHGHNHDHHHGHVRHAHNAYSEIRHMIIHSGLNDHVKALSLAIFLKVAEAEAKIHNKPVNDIHFHEVGAVDSIVDIVGAAICIDFLSPDSILCSTVEVGGGMVQCAHGLYPVPAPATTEILQHMPVRKGTVDYEATTPTGAAILAACAEKFTDRVEFTIQKTGYGIGMKDSAIPNVLRVMLGETAAADEITSSSAFIIECNIDDMNPEFYDYTIDALFSAGAKDVFITPIIMKKSRPAVKLSVLCTPEVENTINEVLFRETSTLGVRKYAVDKTMLERRIEKISTQYGDIQLKSAFYQGVCIKSKPEYDDCANIARSAGIPVSQVYREVERALARKTGSHEG